MRLFVFDFDQTLSVVHVFKTLAGWAEKSPDRGALRIPPPYASTERGQVLKIEELNRIEPFHVDGFARVAFGGQHRVEELRRFLAALAAIAELVICTKGLVGAAQKCLSDLHLLDFFSKVYGNIGSAAYGETSYDRAAADAELRLEERILLGTPTAGAWRGKAELIARMLSKRRLRKEQAVLVEDDPEEIRKAAHICRTHWVREAAGMTTADFAALRRMAETLDCNPPWPTDSGTDIISRRPEAASQGAGLTDKIKDRLIPVPDAQTYASGAVHRSLLDRPPRPAGGSSSLAASPLGPRTASPLQAAGCTSLQAKSHSCGPQSRAASPLRRPMPRSRTREASLTDSRSSL